ncbi:hypothetical protein CAL14_10205 [Bordetella genomosp. 9]|uniref:DUF2271 domain-containing protein n=1 Tax=Bordetella genomosp. 9 TaxID=1416803 RepID=UPI000A293521|nr:DUF2271 domain-containing protein [Bordetella genomosp. 9]ARP90624.1 hypothetical protein CAL14_10205 [Bordetella genomosp. 9]
MRKLIVTAFLAGTVARAAHGAELDVNVEIPRLDVAEYHRPYVAIWIENADQSVAADLAVWYDVAKRNHEGEEWLKDLRQWWRRSGRNQQFPVDGVSGATKPVGTHAVRLDSQAPALAALKPGKYAVVVEAAREVGGRELVRVPFDWPPGKPAAHSQRGEHELGAVAVRVAP